MKKLTATIITVLLLLTVGQVTFASNPIITLQSEFEDLIGLVDSDTFHFSMDDTPTQIDIEGPIKVQITVGGQSVLKNFLIDEGYLITIKGSATGSFEVNNLKLSKDSGTLEIIGGDGITLKSNSIIQDGGIIRANGGTGGISYGIDTESITLNEGTITATGGSNISSAGIRATSITQNGGTINANGSPARNSIEGILVGTIVQNGGTINANGGGMTSTFGIKVETIVQNGGSIVATGGDSGSSSVNYNFGISVRTIVQNGGSIVAIGGVDDAGIFGSSTATITQNDGSIIATGSSKNNIHGIRDFNIITQNGGIISTMGGDGNNSHGIYYINSYSITQNDGYIIVMGGNGNNSHGISAHLSSIVSITQNWGIIISKGLYGAGSHGINLSPISQIIQNGGYIESIGGQVASSHGINGGSIAQVDGIIFAESSAGHGINVEAITQHNGKILAKGTIGANAYGINVETLTQIGGTITANAGNGENAYGINAETLTQRGGTITANAGGAKGANGINVVTLVQDGGTIIANGGPELAVSGDYAYAINANKFTQNNGILIATADNAFNTVAVKFNNLEQNGGTIQGNGNGNGTHGIMVANDTDPTGGNLVQNGGTIIGIGGINGGVGIIANTITQKSGTIKAIGGSSGSASNSIGIKVNNFTVTDVLYISRESVIDSIIVAYLNFNSGATLIPIIDLSKNPTIASGLITVSYNFVVNTNATLKPQFINTFMLKENETLENVLFISSGVNIGSGNKFKEEGNTITMSYVTSINNTNYYLSITREMTPREAFEKGNASSKHTNLVGDIYDFITETDDIKSHSLLIDMLDRIDGSASVEEAVSSIYDVIDSSVYNDIISWNSVARREFNNNFVGLNSKLEGLTTSENKVWADAAISFGKNSNSSENFTNATLGYANKFGNLSAGAQLHASTGNVAANSILSSKVSFGAIAMAKYIYGINNFLNPGASVVVGFNYSNLEHTTKQKSIDVGLHISNKLNITDKITIEPIIGANYILNSFDEFSYDYDNASQLVPKTTYNYLILNANINVSYKVTDSISANFRGFFNYDILKNNFDEDLAIGSEYAITNALDANTMSYGASIDAQYILPSGAATINLGYLLYISENYINHQIKLGINTTF